MPQQRQTLPTISMADHESIWSCVIAMARVPLSGRTGQNTSFKAEQTAAYAREDELYGPHREGMGEAATCMVVALEYVGRPSSCSIGQQRQNPGGQWQARRGEGASPEVVACASWAPIRGR
jgi:hypothetical protein